MVTNIWLSISQAILLLVKCLKLNISSFTSFPLLVLFLLKFLFLFFSAPPADRSETTALEGKQRGRRTDQVRVCILWLHSSYSSCQTDQTGPGTCTFLTQSHFEHASRRLGILMKLCYWNCSRAVNSFCRNRKQMMFMKLIYLRN